VTDAERPAAPPETLSPLKRAIVELRDLRARLDVAELAQRARHEPVAIVGIGCRLPGGVDGPEAYWRLLQDGVDAVTEVPADRWDADAYYDPDPDAPGKMSTRFGAFLEGVDRFSPQFFSISPREAASMDPQQRLLLEVAWEALEHAGQAPDTLAGSKSGVFVGICNSDYFRLLASRPEQIDAYLGTGNAISIAAGRLSYLLGLQGPSLAVDTACSSSLTAVHLAVQSLRAGETDLALAGGVNLILSPEINVNFSKARMMAPDGRCKTFDAAADGYVRGEGCGLVVLKRLADAVAAGDDVLAVIRGTAVNQDGRSGGLTVPNGPAQEAVVRQALADAGVAPHEVDYVEAHGTGTSLGDPIEVRALGAVLGAARPEAQPLLIGSVKTNLGHLEGAAGIAGLIKVVLSLRHGEIPPHLHLHTPSPHIPWEALRVAVPTERTPWPETDGPAVAGVSSFGFSGTNAHVVLGAAPPPAPAPAAPAAPARPRHLLALSAKSAPALREVARRTDALLATAVPAALPDIAFTANAGRAHFDHRLAVAGATVADVRAGLAAFAAGAEAPGLVQGRVVGAEPPEVAFLFTGQGSLAPNAGRALFETQPTFRRAIARCDALLRPHLERPLLSVLYPDAGDGDGTDGAGAHLLSQAAYAQPALFALQYALAELWRSWGVAPTAVAGHSAGEYAAACVAGLFGLEDGLRLIATRGRLLQSLPPDGEMAAVFAPEDRVRAALAPYAAEVALAAVNGPESVVVSGRRGAVGEVLRGLVEAGIECRRLDIALASHSPLVEPVLDALEGAAATVAYERPQMGLVSGLTGELTSLAAAGQPGYWRRHLRQPVRFAAAMDTLYAQGHHVFVEIGPHPTLLGMARRAVAEDFGTWLPSLRQDRDAWEQMAESLGALYAAGVDPDWAGFDRDYPRRRVHLPTYPWERARYWAAAPAGPAPATASSGLTPWAAGAPAAREQATQGPLDLALSTYPARWEALNRLADGYVRRTLRDLGRFALAGERHTVETLLQGAGVAATYRHLLSRWLEHLAAGGALRREGEAFVSPAPLTVPDLDALERAAGAAAGDTPFLLDYVRRCGAALTAVLTGAENALETLFPGGSEETVEHLYHHWAVPRYFNAIVAAVAAAVARRRAGGPPVRILEVGAGTGGTTATVLPALPATGVRYDFTDVSDFFLARAAQKFSAFPFVRYGRLNVEAEPGAQGYAPGTYDVVVAANVLHATQDLDATLRHTRELLAADGVLVLYETTAHPLWLDITTGLIEGWQRFTDTWRADHPLLDPQRWQAALLANGFAEAVAFPGPGAPAEVLGQHVVIGRGPAGVAAAPAAVTADGAAPAAAGWTAGPADGPDRDAAAAAAAAFRERLAATPPSMRGDLVLEYVLAGLARVLHLAPGQPVDPDRRLMDLGIDSLMAVELRNRLSTGLDLRRKLPATLVFDYPTPRAIGVYVHRLLEEVDGPPGVPAAPAAPGGPGGDAPVRDAAAQAAQAAQVAELSEDEVEALLLERLGRL
jgi:acyl transferase domain-containing protein/SAM-dependent methyltransferase